MKNFLVKCKEGLKSTLTIPLLIAFIFFSLFIANCFIQVANESYIESRAKEIAATYSLEEIRDMAFDIPLTFKGSDVSKARDILYRAIELSRTDYPEVEARVHELTAITMPEKQ